MPVRTKVHQKTILEKRMLVKSIGRHNSGLASQLHQKKIAALDIDVRPDGKGLPAGSGTVQEGRKLYAQKCASCHGNNGVGGPYSHLVSSDTSKARTIGNYWPYATTVF